MKRTLITILLGAVLAGVPVFAESREPALRPDDETVVGANASASPQYRYRRRYRRRYYRRRYVMRRRYYYRRRYHRRRDRSRY